MTSETIVKKMNAKAKELGYSRYYIAKETGYNESMVGDYLNGKRQFPLDRFLGVCAVLGMELSDF